MFCAALAGFLLIVTAFPRDARTLELENREFRKRPALTAENLLGGELDGQFEAYVSDRVGYRASFTARALEYGGFYGLPSENGARLDGTLLSFSDRLVEIFTYSEAGARDYADALNRYRAALGENVRVFSLIAPTQLEFLPELYRSVSDSQLAAIRAVNARLSGITPVDAYASIMAHAEEYVYFRTDHHWTALGAYYAYRAYADAAGFEPLGLEEYEAGHLEGFLGYLYNQAPSDGMEQNPDTLTYYAYKGALTTSEKLLVLPSAGEKVLYSVFLGGDHAIYELRTSVKNGKTAVIIKGSYANAFIPWIAPHYENIVVLDPRAFEGSAIEKIAEYGDVDLIFLNYVLSTSFDDFIIKLDGMR
jgi:hypothetical protein